MLLEVEYPSESQIQHWAKVLRDRGLADMAVPILDLLKVWGYVGGQALWLLAPFLGERRLAPWAEVLEHPETLSQLQHYLTEGEAQS